MMAWDAVNNYIDYFKNLSPQDITGFPQWLAGATRPQPEFQGWGPQGWKHSADWLKEQLDANPLGFAAGTIKTPKYKDITAASIKTPTAASRGVADAATDRWKSLKDLEDIFGTDLPAEHVPYRQQLIDELKGYHESNQMPTDFLNEFVTKYLKTPKKAAWEDWSLD